MASILPKPKLTSHPVDVGARHEAAILAALIQRGYDVLVPSGVNHRYDLVIDLNGEMLRCQCKTGRLRNGVIKFPARSIRVNTHGIFRRRYEGEIELFLVFCPVNQRIYAVPVEDCAADEVSLRLEETRNGQARFIRWARDYELPE